MGPEQVLPLQDQSGAENNDNEDWIILFVS